MNLLLSILGFIFVFSVTNGADISFDQNYKVTWGNDHVIPLNQGTQVQLFMDKSSGAGFESKLSYGSGFIHMRIKLPDKDSAGVVTAFYLTSKGDNHDELDFEFLGNREGKPITLQTNVFANGLGNREQRVSLWFDPTADFHDYKILWNEHQIVYFVDDIPIRVFKNNTKKGVSYPSHPMQVESSTNLSPCFSQNYWWNSEKYWKLDNAQQKAYENVKNKYLSYDYCNDKTRFSTIPPECPQ
ncbi:Xyloglucan endotransglucosylase/hydrolase [Euphorbia peplus]|nr:Xyloglucan endotransglucosylase/hydrolase [Euphorbia peplus]